MMSVLPKLAALGVVLGSLACASTPLHADPDSAAGKFELAERDLDDDLYPEALKGFADVKAKFPYSKFAALADLRIADTHFERGKYIEAIDAYRNFLKYNPEHSEAAYAMYRIATSYHEQMPSDFFILPPAAEKDQASTRLAISAFRDMLTRFPESEHAEAARKELDECRLVLAQHELYVANFYFAREKWHAALSRAEGLLRDYPGLGLDPEALLLVARAHLQEGSMKEARQALERLGQDFPSSTEAATGRGLLSKITASPSKGDASQQGTPADG